MRKGIQSPEISVENSTVCTTFEADVQFVAGIVDPQGGTDRNADDTADDPFNKGIDLGIVYTANAGFRTTHDFGSFSKTGFGGSKTSTLKALKSGISDTSTPSTTDNTDIKDAAGNIVVDIDACEPLTHDLYTKEGPSALNRPENCARVLSTSGYAYYGDYSVTITPSAGLSWSRNSWDQIPTGAAARCSGTTFVASEQVDVCELLEEEVALIDDGTVTAIPVVSVGGASPAGQGADRENQAKLQGFDLMLPVDPTQWKHLRYNDDTTAARYDDLDLYDTSVADGADPDETSTASVTYSFNDTGRLNGAPQDDTDDTTDNPTYANVWVPILDSKGAPMYGDLGKVDAATATQAGVGVTGGTFDPATSEDTLTEGHASYAGPFGGDNVPDNFTIETYNGSESARMCSKDDGGEDGSGRTRRIFTDGSDPGSGSVGATGGAGTTHDIVSLRTGGTLCDAEGVEIETTVTFKDDMGLGCSVERSFTLTCDWDASGGMTPHQAQTVELVGADLPTAAANIGVANAEDFVSCTVDMN